MEQQRVIFELASEFCGVEIATAESIIRMQAITAVPHTPAFVEGVTNLRGTILPMMGLRKCVGLASQAETKDSRVVVDGVSEMLRVAADAIEPPPLVTTVEMTCLKGIAQVADGVERRQRLIILPDLSQVLSGREQAQLRAPAAHDPAKGLSRS